MRILSSLVGLIFGAFAILFALDNRAPVAVNLWPTPFEAEMPLFLVGFFFGLLGLLVGLFMGWLMNQPAQRENRRLRRELKMRPVPAATQSRDLAPVQPANQPTTPPPSS